jgi:Xaa-Pro dipeptidase
MGPAFPNSEYRERLDCARQALERAGFDGCICVAPEHLYYLGGYDANTYFVDQGLIFTIGSDNPTLVIREVDVPLAQQTSWLSDVRTYHFGAQDAADLIAAVAKEKGLLGSRIGLDLQAYALPGASALRLIHALGPSTVGDSTDTVGKLRVVLSPRELA